MVVPMRSVATALMRSVDQGPAWNSDVTKSSASGRYTVSKSIPTTTGTKPRRKSCRDHNQTSVAVVMCCIWWINTITNVNKNEFQITVQRGCDRIFWKKSLTRLMLDSRLFWIYFQSNSAPLAPIHSSRNLVRRTSAPAQPIPAVKTLAWPLPGIPFSTNHIPTRSAKSMEYLRNS